MKQSLLLFLIGTLIITVSCNGPKSKKAEEKKESTEIATPDVVTVLPDLQSVSNVAALFEMLDVQYHSDIVNEPVNALKYVDDKRKSAANMGVYLGDMVYVMATDGYQEAYKNYGAVMQLAQSLGLENVFPNLLIDRYESENMNSGQVLKMLEEGLAKSEKNFSDSDTNEFYALLLYGNYIEKLHIISRLVQKTAESDLPAEVSASLNRTLLVFMAKQRLPLEKLQGIMAEFPSDVVDNDAISTLIGNYKELEANSESITALKPMEMYKAKEVKALYSQIDKIRAGLVK